MGKEADKIFSTFPDIETVADEDPEERFNQVLKHFDDYFVPKRNVVHERANFHNAVQKVESFVRELYELAEHCQFRADVRDESIRDQLVFGLRDKELTRKLQLESDLPLNKAIDMARNFETIESQVNSQSRMNIDSLSNHRFNPSRPRLHNRHSQKGRQKPNTNPSHGRSASKNKPSSSATPDRRMNRCN
ncbi:Pol polyprotein [Elysia marginata]|uniref:Pol polyprotein n=1 Tax=Elysia marginata TaxID=1093978 RepID=A0AAV4IUX6_9GAST|nr:Pol polyprotein [Elysia marginata]